MTPCCQGDVSLLSCIKKYWDIQAEKRGSIKCPYGNTEISIQFTEFYRSEKRSDPTVIDVPCMGLWEFLFTLKHCLDTCKEPGCRTWSK